MIPASFVAALLLLNPASADAAAAYRLRWVMVHNHSPVYKLGAQAFAARVEKETGGDVVVEVLDPAEYAQRYRGGRRASVMAMMDDAASGKVEIIQTYSAALGRKYSRSLEALELPFLFRDYGHAETVLNGAIGRDLMDSLEKNSPLHAFGFTYSGGFGVFATVNREMHEPRDLQGTRLFMKIGRSSSATAGRLGVEAWTGGPEGYGPLARAGLVDGVETVYTCFADYHDDRYSKVVTETNHFLLTTMVVINKKFFYGLPKRDRTIIERAARDTTDKERRDSIVLNSALRQDLIKRGVKIVMPTDKEKKALENALTPVTNELAPSLGREVVERIRSTATR